MQVKLEQKPEMTFIGLSTEIRPEEGYVKCPAFWDKEYNQRFAHLWQTMKPETAVEKAILENKIGMYALCICNGNGFTYMIAGEYQGGDVPEGLKLHTFAERDWAQFSEKGALPNSLQKLNDELRNHWIPENQEKYRINGNDMIEVYSAENPQSPDYECGIWLPIRIL